MQDRTNRMKLVVVAIVALLAIFVFAPTSASTRAVVGDFNPAAVYKAKCTACHGKQAEKKFDASKSDEELVDILLHSKKPGMPAFAIVGLPDGSWPMLCA